MYYVVTGGGEENEGKKKQMNSRDLKPGSDKLGICVDCGQRTDGHGGKVKEKTGIWSDLCDDCFAHREDAADKVNAPK